MPIALLLQIIKENPTPENQEALATALSKITSLDLSNRKLSGTEIFYLSTALQRNTSVTTLIISGNDWGEYDFRLYITAVLSIAKIIRVNSYLTSLNLENNKINNQGVYLLANALQHNTAVTELNLSHNQVSNRGVEAIADALKSAHLTNLNLEDNQITGVKKLAEVLEDNTYLKFLNLASNLLYNNGAYYLSKALRYNKSLISLRLEDNMIFKEGIKMLLRGIAHSDHRVYPRTLLGTELLAKESSNARIEDHLQLAYSNNELLVLIRQGNELLIADFRKDVLERRRSTINSRSLSPASISMSSRSDLPSLSSSEKEEEEGKNLSSRSERKTSFS